MPLDPLRATRSSSRARTERVPGDGTIAPGLTPEQKILQQPKVPRTPVQTAVGGRAIAGTTELVRVQGRDTELMLPKGTSFAAWHKAIVASGAFAAQMDVIGKLAPVSQAQTHAQMQDPAPIDARPVIGIVISEPRMLLKDTHKNTENLIQLVESMGCRPVLIPPCADIAVTGGPDARARAIAAMASQLDGLLGPGGADVHPSIYGEKDTSSINTNVLRDRFEADFVNVALDCDLFAFGICRSHQLWNAAAGGSLIQDVQEENVASISHKEGHHPMKVARRSMIFEEVRQEALRVNSLHHQAVDFAGWGFRVVGRTRDAETGKDMIEATERWNGITTQYHPELMQEDAGQRALLSTLGRRAHVFALLKHTKPASIGELLTAMRDDPRYEASDLAWAQRELSRRLGR